MNRKHLKRLVRLMYKFDDCPELDEYGGKIFGRPVRGTWRLFRHIASRATANVWIWSYKKETASYPRIDVPLFEEFSTILLHEVAHGWCYFLKADPSQDYTNGADEERVCWDVSMLVCKMLGITYHEKSARLCYDFWLLSQTNDTKGLCSLMKKLPAHIQQ